MTTTRTMLLGSALALCMQAASADAGLRVGPTDATNGFPAYLVDVNNTALQLCLDGDGVTGPCLFAPAASLPGNVWAATVGFGAEAAYNFATARILMPSGRRADLSIGLVAGYRAGTVANGQQTVASRVSYRIGVAGPGLYKVYHPYLAYPACLPETHVVPVGAPLTISHVNEIGSGTPFRAVLLPQTGSMLAWDPAVAPAAPAGYLGDAQMPHAVTGSLCNVNAFRIEGPNIGGAGVGVAGTSLFNVSGKRYTAAATVPALAVDRVTYDRVGTTTRLNVFARAAAGATVTMAAIFGVSPATTLRSDGAGNFFGQITGNFSPAGFVSLSTNPAVPTASVAALVTDSVEVISAVFSPTANTLQVRATSSDRVVPPVLTARIGDAPPMVMTRNAATGEYAASLVGVVAPPPSVTVTSSKGGQRRAQPAGLSDMRLASEIVLP